MDDIERRLARLEERVRGLVAVRTLTRTSSSGEGDQIAGEETTPDEASGGYSIPGQRIQHFGFSSVPPTTLRGVMVFARAGITNGAIVAEESGSYAPTLDEGEVAIFSKASGAVIKIDADGNVSVTAAPGKNVSVTASGTGAVNVSASPVTGTVGLGPVANLPVLVQGAFDSMGVPVTQAPAAIATIVKAG